MEFGILMSYVYAFVFIYEFSVLCLMKCSSDSCSIYVSCYISLFVVEKCNMIATSNLYGK